MKRIIVIALTLLAVAPLQAQTNTASDTTTNLSVVQAVIGQTNAPAVKPTLTLSEKFPDITNIWTAIMAVGEITTIDGAYTAVANGQRGWGVAVSSGLWPFNTGGVRILPGLGLATASVQDGTTLVVPEVGVAVKVIDATVVQNFLLAIPVFGQLFKATKLNLSKTTAFVGGGILPNVDTKHLDKGLAGTVALGGLTWGD